MRWRCRFAAAEAPYAVKRSHGIAPRVAGTHYFSGEYVLNTTAKPTHNLSLVVTYGSAVTLGRAEYPTISVIRAWSLTTI